MRSRRAITRGALRGSSVDIEFSAAEDSAGVARAQIDVGGDQIEIIKDTGEGTASWDGHAAALQRADVDALRDLVLTLGPELLPTPDSRPTAQNDLLMRLASLLADAPIGLPLTAQEVPRPAAQLSEDAAPVEDLTSVRQVVCTDLPRPGRSGVVPAACQVSDDDGIAYTSCATLTRTFWHDARSHCFAPFNVRSGPDSTDCLGRCGWGCGAWGGGIYTVDCGDHDYCVRAHPEGGNPSNPSHNDCGDEWWNADDDVIWGLPNCPWG